MRRDIAPRRKAVRLMVISAVMATGIGASCVDEKPADDLDYLVWEVCRQVRAAGATVERVDGILHDASRHGPIMDRVEAECGDDIAAVYGAPTSSHNEATENGELSGR